ncbi:unnamed protein product [Somion occarium]|uniref:Mitochondrial import inner membrane translocase subunit TIM50 n=1 Tax=Somion occarium TaxID=3059160 RepID=A0ABP1DFH3_9APHY
MASPESPQLPVSQSSKGKELEGESASAQPAEGLSALDNTSRVPVSPAQDTHTSTAASDVPNGQATTSGTVPEPSKPEHVPSPPEQSTSATGDVAPPPTPSAPLTSSSPAKDKPDEPDRTNDAEKDKASLNTTLTGTQTHTHTQTRRKEGNTVSDGAHTASSSHEEKKRPKSRSKTKKKAKKPSVFSRLFHVFVPCIATSGRFHDADIELNKAAQPTSEPAPLTATQEEPSAKAAEEPAPTKQPTEPNGNEHLEAKPEPALPENEKLPTPLQSIEIPEAGESDIVVPPTPTRSLLPKEETEGVTSGAVVPPGSTGTPEETHHEPPTHTQDSENESDGSTSFTEDEDLDESSPMDEIEDDEERLIMQGGAGIPVGPDGMPKPLLPPVSPKHVGRKCLVLDLDETLVHSSFKSIQQADYVVPVEIEYHWHNVYVIKRPGVDSFLKKMGEIYEVVVFTASLSKYADPVLDKLDIHRVVSHRLFRESCYNHRGNYVKVSFNALTDRALAHIDRNCRIFRSLDDLYRTRSSLTIPQLLISSILIMPYLCRLGSLTRTTRS